MKPLRMALSVLALAFASAQGSRGPALPQDRKETLARLRGDLAAAEARIASHPDSAGPHLDRLRILYVLGVGKEEYLAEAERETAWLEGRAGGDRARLNLVRAYRGAILVAHAKHGFNLNRKLRLLKEGGALLDSAVAEEPGGAETRYLRLVSGFYLPFFLGRKPIVREDFAALARILPEVTDGFPPRWYLSVAGFVRDEGDLGAADEDRLAREMERAAARLPDGERGARE